jgi:hypothetical protein
MTVPVTIKYEKSTKDNPFYSNALWLFSREAKSLSMVKPRLSAPRSELGILHQQPIRHRPNLFPGRHSSRVQTHGWQVAQV